MSKNETELSIPLDESQYEWVELPSKGECYAHKKSKVPVAYLTAAEALGISVEDAKNMIREDNKKSVVKSQMRSSTLSKEQQDAVANKAQRDEKTGRWYVNTINGDKIDVSDDQKLKANLDNIVSDNKDEAAVQYAQNTLSFVEKIEATTKQIDAKLGRLSFDNFGETVNQSNRNTLDYYSKNIESVISAIQTDRKESIKAQEKLLKKLATIGDDIVKALKTIENPYDGIDMDKEKQKIDIQEAQNKYRRNIKGRMDTWDEKWNKTVAVNAMERGGDSGWNWWKNRFSAMVQGFTSSNEDLDKRARATGYIDKNGKPVAINEETVKPIHDGIVSMSKSILQGGETVSNDMKSNTFAAGVIKNIHDGVASIIKSDSKDKVVSGNGRPMAVAANKVTPVHDGTASIAKSDPKDSAIFAKTGGPFDTLFNGIFDKINEIYGVYSGRINHDNVSPNIVVRPVPIAHDGVFPSPVSIDNTDSQNTHSQYNTQTNETQKGQFDVNVRGEINLKANGQSINLLNELQTNPSLVRAITDLISDSISKKTHGGRAIPGGQKW